MPTDPGTDLPIAVAIGPTIGPAIGQAIDPTIDPATGMESDTTSASSEAVWHGTAKKRLNKKYSPPKLINEAVMTLLESFPNTRKQDTMPTGLTSAAQNNPAKEDEA